MRMITTVLALFILCIGAAQASQCRLKKSIPFDGSLLETRYFTDLKTDQAPKFLRAGTYNPSKDTLAMLVFEIVNNGSLSSYGGMKLGIEGKPDVIGFSNSYAGETRLDGGKDEYEGVTTYWTRWSVVYPDAPGEAITQVRIGVVGNKMISFQITHPVFEITGQEGRYTYTRFTGENQSFCVTSARLED
ncbi:MAG TPA: hypothetical protein VNJ01_09275 [Bacteriovoracaceae bacterium]|nr:hypothetical protein [Bacteriovoracaceae bacterium]